MSVTYKNNADPQICQQCRGLCCQGHPGVWIDPERFLACFDLPRPKSQDALRHMLPGRLTLRDIDGVLIPAPKDTGAGCIFLKAQGCLLPESTRPEQCLALTPAIETLIDGEIRCELPAEGSTLKALRNWKDFWDSR